MDKESLRQYRSTSWCSLVDATEGVFLLKDAASCVEVNRRQ
jgi:hypothetical protein